MPVPWLEQALDLLDESADIGSQGEFIMALVETLELCDMAETSLHLLLLIIDCSDLILPYPSVLLVQLLPLRLAAVLMAVVMVPPAQC